MSSGPLERTPTPNPLGDGPSDTNPLLDAIREGDVVVARSDSTITEAWYWMDDGGRYRRETFAGTPPAVHQDWGVDPLCTASKLAGRLRAGRSTVRVTGLEELRKRRQYRNVALAFRTWRRMEWSLQERGDVRRD